MFTPELVSIIIFSLLGLEAGPQQPGRRHQHPSAGHHVERESHRSRDVKKREGKIFSGNICLKGKILAWNSFINAKEHFTGSPHK